MSLLARAFRPRAALKITPEAARALSDYGSTAGFAVSPEGAQRISAVFACVQVIAEDIAKLPLILYRRLPDGGRERATDHPAYRLTHDAPNDWQTSFEFREMLQGHLGLRGNAFAFVNRYGKELRELIAIHPDRVQVKRAADYTPSYTLDGQPIPASKLLHLKDRSLDGVTGISRISYARNAIGLAGATEKHGGLMFRNGARPGLKLQLPVGASALKPEQEEDLKASIERSTGGDNAFRVLVLKHGMDVDTIGISNEDAQYLELRGFQIAEIARFYRMPLHKIQDLARSTNNNIEHQALEYVTDCLLSWARRWEQALSRTLLTAEERRTYYFEFLFDALLRGDAKSRADALAVQRQNGIINADEWREIENRNPLPDGEGQHYLVNGNMIPASEAARPRSRPQENAA